MSAFATLSARRTFRLHWFTCGLGYICRHHYLFLPCSTDTSEEHFQLAINIYHDVLCTQATAASKKHSPGTGRRGLRFTFSVDHDFTFNYVVEVCHVDPTYDCLLSTVPADPLLLRPDTDVGVTTSYGEVNSCDAQTMLSARPLATLFLVTSTLLSPLLPSSSRVTLITIALEEPTERMEKLFTSLDH